MGSFLTLFLPRYDFTLDCFATRLNRVCERYFSAAFELEAAGTNFFRQEISSDDFVWCFPHPRHASAMIGHLNDQKARGVFLLVCIPSQVAMARVFRAGKTANFVRDITLIKPTWVCGEDVKSTFFKGKARQNVCLVEFDFDVVNALAFE